MCLGIVDNHFAFRGQCVALRGIGVGSWLNLEHFMVGLPGLDGMLRTALDAACPGTMDAFDDSFFTDADAAYLRSLGVNLIRVPFSYRLVWDEATGRPCPEGLAKLRRLADICDRHGLFYLPDLHTTPGGQSPDWHSECETGVPLFWRHRALRAQTAEVWRAVAEALKDSEYLAGYDLLNEPVPPEGGVDALNEFHRMAARAIREVDESHLLFVEGCRFSMDFRGVTLPDPGRSAYTYHFYPAVWEEALADPALPEDERRSGFRRAHDAILSTFDGDPGPLLCGETGFELQTLGDEAGLGMLEAVVDTIEAVGAGWCLWSYKDTGMMGLRSPAPGSAWRELADDVSRSWNHHLDMRRGDDLARRISESWFGGVLSPSERYAMQFRLRAALFMPEVEHVLKPALARMSPERLAQLGGDFALERCPARPGYERLLRRRCGAAFTETL